MNWTPCAIAVYVIAGFLTFGHVYNANYVPPQPLVDCGKKPEVLGDGWDEYWDCRRDNIDRKYGATPPFVAAIPAFYAAIAWPVYWGGKIAIKVTK
jgi:hypothetical protein